MSPEKNTNKNTGLILLAAGASVRLGHPKQLLMYNGQTLLQNSLQSALASGAQPLIVVLGANADTIKNEIKNDRLHVVINAQWEKGMASSIQSGVKAIVEMTPDAEGIIVMVCDQPYVTSSLLNELITTHEKTGKQIVACSYENSFGPPVFFHRSFFDKLLQLEGDTGARSIVSQHIDLVELIPFPEGTFDIDTEADFERIKYNNKQMMN